MAKLSKKFDPFKLTGRKRPTDPTELAELKEELAEVVLDAVLDDIGGGRSPVAGRKWKYGLSPEYKKVKAEISSSVFANLELSGDLLDNLEVVPAEGGKLEIKVEGSDALVGKAIGNNIGSYGKPRGDVNKARPFIPRKGETFRRGIVGLMREVIEDFDDA